MWSSIFVFAFSILNRFEANDVSVEFLSLIDIFAIKPNGCQG
jgi:hypothetical protein